MIPQSMVLLGVGPREEEEQLEQRPFYTRSQSPFTSQPPATSSWRKSHQGWQHHPQAGKNSRAAKSNTSWPRVITTLRLDIMPLNSFKAVITAVTWAAAWQVRAEQANTLFLLLSVTHYTRNISSAQWLSTDSETLQSKISGIMRRKKCYF